MSDKYFPHKGRVLVNLFGKDKYVDVVMTEKAFNNPLPSYGECEDCLYIGRSEDYYASPHFKDRNAVRVERTDFIRERKAYV